MKNLIKNKLVRNYNFRLGANCFMKNWKLVVFYRKHSHKSPGIFFFSKAAPFSVRNIALCDFFFHLEIYIKPDSESESLIKSSKNAIGECIYTNFADLQSR